MVTTYVALNFAYFESQGHRKIFGTTAYKFINKSIIPDLQRYFYPRVTDRI